MSQLYPLLVALALTAAAPAADELVGQWQFAGCDGVTVTDRSSLGNDGRIEFGTLRPERATTSLELDGLGAAVAIPLTHLWGRTTALTTSFWVRADELRQSTVLFGIPNTNDQWTTPVFGMYLSDRQVVFGLWLEEGHGKVLVTSPEELPRAAWVHLAGTYDGHDARLYVDGAEVAAQPATGALAFNQRPLLIGRGYGGKPSLKGRVGELRVYHRAFAAAEVAALYAQTNAGYDLTRPAPPRRRDGTVTVETHGSSPGGDRPWKKQPTRLLELLDGYHPGAATVPQDRYGGRLDRPAQAASGYFTTTRLGRRHWLVDPDGRLFFHVGLNGVVEPAQVTANFGSPERWAETVTAQLREAGFNGLGNWLSKRVSTLPNRLVWVLRKDFMFAFARQKKLVEPAAGTQGFTQRCMPVFHPDFPAFCDAFGQDLAATAADPCLLGIMTDNELQCPVDLLDRFLALDATNPDLKPNRDAATAWLAAQHATPGGLTQRLRYQFIAYAFERYYQIVTRAIRKYDPHHLYLGSRLNYHGGEFDNPYLWRAMAPYHDVVSINYYGYWGPDPETLAHWEEWGGKPILFTEWYAKALDAPGLANTHGAGWLVHTQEDRARYYQHFALGALETPNVVGWHFFKYLDDPATSTALDAAGGANKGLCDVAGRPYPPLLARARAVNCEVYPLIDFFDARR